jgi:hypothetical protein
MCVRGVCTPGGTPNRTRAPRGVTRKPSRVGDGGETTVLALAWSAEEPRPMTLSFGCCGPEEVGGR